MGQLWQESFLFRTLRSIDVWYHEVFRFDRWRRILWVMKYDRRPDYSSSTSPTRPIAWGPFDPACPAETFRTGQRDDQQEFEINSERCCGWSVGDDCGTSPATSGPPVCVAINVPDGRVVGQSRRSTVNSGCDPAMKTHNPPEAKWRGEGRCRRCLSGEWWVARLLNNWVPVVEGATTPFRYALSTKAGCECVSPCGAGSHGGRSRDHSCLHWRSQWFWFDLSGSHVGWSPARGRWMCSTPLHETLLRQTFSVLVGRFHGDHSLCASRRGRGHLCHHQTRSCGRRVHSSPELVDTCAREHQQWQDEGVERRRRQASSLRGHGQNRTSGWSGSQRVEGGQKWPPSARIYCCWEHPWPPRFRCCPAPENVKGTRAVSVTNPEFTRCAGGLASLVAACVVEMLNNHPRTPCLQAAAAAAEQLDVLPGFTPPNSTGTRGERARNFPHRLEARDFLTNRASTPRPAVHDHDGVKTRNGAISRRPGSWGPVHSVSNRRWNTDWPTPVPHPPLAAPSSHILHVQAHLPPSTRFPCHRAACARAGVLGRRGFAVESAAARVCREGGARVTTNVLVRDMEPMFSGVQLAMDTKLVSTLRCDSSVPTKRQRRCRRVGGPTRQSSPRGAGGWSGRPFGQKRPGTSSISWHGARCATNQRSWSAGFNAWGGRPSCHAVPPRCVEVGRGRRHSSFPWSGVHFQVRAWECLSRSVGAWMSCFERLNVTSSSLSVSKKNEISQVCFNVDIVHGK